MAGPARPASDADDRIDAENRATLAPVFDRLGPENAAYVMKIRSEVRAGTVSSRLLDQVRLFRNLPGVRWRYRVHEQILPAVAERGGDTRWTQVVIDHTGYQDEAFRKRKLERNLRLMLIEHEEEPGDSFTLFNLGRTYLDLGQTGEAVRLFRESLALSKPNLSIVRKLHSLIAQAEHQLGRHSEALAACREGLRRYPEDAELLYQHALLCRQTGDPTGAEESLVRLLRSWPGAYFDMLDAGLRG